MFLGYRNGNGQGIVAKLKVGNIHTLKAFKLVKTFYVKKSENYVKIVIQFSLLVESIT